MGDIYITIVTDGIEPYHIMITREFLLDDIEFVINKVAKSIKKIHEESEKIYILNKIEKE